MVVEAKVVEQLMLPLVVALPFTEQVNNPLCRSLFKLYAMSDGSIDSCDMHLLIPALLLKRTLMKSGESWGKSYHLATGKGRSCTPISRLSTHIYMNFIPYNYLCRQRTLIAFLNQSWTS
jgi:hypothetical protein